MKDNTLKHKVYTRISDTDMKHIENICTKHNLSKAEAIRRLIHLGLDKDDEHKDGQRALNKLIVETAMILRESTKGKDVYDTAVARGKEFIKNHNL